MNALQGIKVLDLTTRLPGPLACKQLLEMGAEVTKLEDTHFPDSFLEPQLAKLDHSFVDWYDNINRGKKITRLSFKSQTDQVRSLLEEADIVLVAQPQKVTEALPLSSLSPKPRVILELFSSAEARPLHDLNILAETGFLKLHLESGQHSPPFLPIAGVSFAQRAALVGLSLFCQAQKEKRTLFHKIYLDQEFTHVFSHLWSDKLKAESRTKFLHNGLYPCYACYQNSEKDWVVLACVEEKFWNEFVSILGLNLSSLDRFDKSPRVFKTISDALLTLSTSKIEELLSDKQICVSILKS